MQTFPDNSLTQKWPYNNLSDNMINKSIRSRGDKCTIRLDFI